MGAILLGIIVYAVARDHRESTAQAEREEGVDGLLRDKTRKLNLAASALLVCASRSLTPQQTQSTKATCGTIRLGSSG
jgi:hypothetical protein